MRKILSSSKKQKCYIRKRCLYKRNERENSRNIHLHDPYIAKHIYLKKKYCSIFLNKTYRRYILFCFRLLGNKYYTNVLKQLLSEKYPLKKQIINMN